MVANKNIQSSTMMTRKLSWVIDISGIQILLFGMPLEAQAFVVILSVARIASYPFSLFTVTAYITTLKAVVDVFIVLTWCLQWLCLSGHLKLILM